MRSAGSGNDGSEQITGRWVCISGLVAFFGSLGMVPLAHLGSDVPAVPPGQVRSYFFGEEYGEAWDPPTTFTAAAVRRFLQIFFEKVPGISAEGGIPADANKEMKKALSS